MNLHSNRLPTPSTGVAVALPEDSIYREYMNIHETANEADALHGNRLRRRAGGAAPLPSPVCAHD